MPTDYLDDPFTPVDVKDTIAPVAIPGIPTVAEAESNDPLKGLAEADRAEVVRLRSEHPDYTANKEKWGFLLKSYEGGPNYVDETTLFRHQRENEESYDDRLARAAYVNYTAPLVDFVPDYIFAKPPERSPDSLVQQIFDQFIEDVDRAGTHINDFMREVAIDTRLFGYCWIGVDKPTIPPSEPTDTLSVQRAKELGVDVPYWFIVRPLEVLNWNTNRHGQYTYFKRREYVTEQDGLTQTQLEQYTEWTPAEIKISQIDITDPQKLRLLAPAQIPNLQKRIPFIPSFNRRSKANKDMGTSAVQDIAYQNRSVFNFSSLIGEFLARQCVTGDTLIECPRDLEKYPDGIPIQELIGKEFLTYAWSVEDERLTLRKAFDVRKTGEQKEVWQVRFEYVDEYHRTHIGHLDATPDHPILRQDDQYVALRDLRPGDRLVPLTRWIAASGRGNRSPVQEGRPHLLQGLSPYSGIAEHRFIVRERGEELRKGCEVHHLDDSCLNNEPSNLVQITREEHAKLNSARMSVRSREWWAKASLKERNKILDKAHEACKEWWKNEPGAVERRNQKQAKTIKATLAKLTPEQRSAKFARANKVRGPEEKRQWWAEASLETRRRIADKHREGSNRAWANASPVQRQARIDRAREGLKQWWANASPEEHLARAARIQEGRTRAREQKAVERVNHRVLSVAFLGHQDVYNMEVEGLHNYVANGVVVHNCFNVLAMEADTSLPTVDRQSGDIGTSNVIEFPQGAKVPAYVSPPVDPAAFIQSERSNAIQEMYRQAAQDAMSELFGADTRSGDAARQSFGRTTPVIARLADSLQQVEVEALKLWATMAGRAWGAGKVSYRDDYGSESVSDMLLSLTAIFRQIQVLSPTWVKAEWKRVVRTFDSRIDPKTMATIMQEIDGVSNEVILDLIKSKPKNANTTPGMPATAQMLQGQTQQALGTDTRRSIQSGDASATKEALPDANKRTSRPQATVR